MSPKEFDKLHQAYIRQRNPQPLPPMRAHQQYTASNVLGRMAAIEKSARLHNTGAAASAEAGEGEAPASTPAPSLDPLALSKRLMRNGLISGPMQDTWQTKPFVQKLKEQNQSWKKAVEQVISAGEGPKGIALTQ